MGIHGCTGFDPAEVLNSPVNWNRAKLGVLLPKGGAFKEIDCYENHFGDLIQVRL